MSLASSVESTLTKETLPTSFPQKRPFQETSFVDYFNVISIVGATLGAIGSVMSLSPFPSVLCLGYLGWRALDNTDITGSFSRVVLRQLLGDRLSRSITPGPDKDFYNHNRNKALEMLPNGSTNVQIPLSEKENLDGLWIPAIKSTKKVMVVFPGNTMTAGAMWPWGKWYSENGYNVLLTTMRGYKGDDGFGSCGKRLGIDGEIELIEDAAATIAFVEKMGFSAISLHGYSIGGYIAASLAFYHSKIEKVILDRAFTCFIDLASYTTKGMLSPQVLLHTYKTPPKDHDKYIATGFDTISLVGANQNTAFLVLQANNDRFVPLNFGIRLSEKAKTAQLVLFEGKHAVECAFENLTNYPDFDGKTTEIALKLKEDLERALTGFLDMADKTEKLII